MALRLKPIDLLLPEDCANKPPGGLLGLGAGVHSQVDGGGARSLFRRDVQGRRTSGDSHTAFFSFPAETSTWNYTGPKPDPNFTWW